MKALHFDDADFARHYVEDGPGRFVPGYAVMQRMAAQLIAERAPEGADILVLGAGGGLETLALAQVQPNWRFHGVDPSAEMLALAKTVCGPVLSRTEWTEGYIQDAPAGPFDGATCLLTLHFVPDDGGKLETLGALRRRLKPGAPLVLVDLCLDKAASNYDDRRDRYARFALNSGADADDVEATRTRLKEVLHTVPPARNEALLAEAGFKGIELFYAGLSWRGWVAYA
ncbi:class I SAM-dependent methyltransferase [Brevundimonas sp. 2R-24]|uniref:Class I SAM-dependent methyltransferase n=1 Tax=Peiella sedimenti TaxID=3061083 RepID=A0ABT8SMD9_9CAUL|nr:class I SAM-dependent methyltransferase [Caulobacteraceae bacterium XZ-24]